MAIDLRNPQGKYGGSVQAAAQILQHLGQVEKDREERELTDTVLSGIASGKDFGSILADVSGKMASPSFAGGPRGLLQRASSMFAPHSSETGQVLSKMGLSMMDPRRQATAEATGGRAELYGEQAQTAREMRPGQVATQEARAGATSAQEAARRASEALATERAKTVEATRPGQVARQGLTEARTGLAREQTKSLTESRPGITQGRQAQTELTRERTETERRRRDLNYPKVGATEQMTGKGPIETQGAVEGLEDVWERFDAGEQEEIRRYDDEYRSRYPQMRQDWIDKVRSMAP